MALTMGDPAGIGPEIIVRAFQSMPDLLGGCFVAGDLAVMRRAAAICGIDNANRRVVLIDHPTDLAFCPAQTIAVLQTTAAAMSPPELGIVSAAAGRMAADAVRWAAQACLRGEILAMVTAPLNKAALGAAGEDFPGHTELLQAEAARYCQVPLQQMPVRMMLMNDELRVVLVSVHLALRAAIDAVTEESVLETLEVAHAALHKALGRVPVIAVAALNPHAGEGGLFGTEEQTVIRPAILAAHGRGMQVDGPFAPDTVFMNARSGSGDGPKADAVIAMYHDQGLIPVKYNGLDQGVNVTLGLPLVRTSPDHGTAFDLAGKGTARPDSLLAAVRAARRMLPSA